MPLRSESRIEVLSLPRVPAASVSQRSGVGVRPLDRLTTGSREARPRGGGPREDYARTVFGGRAAGLQEPKSRTRVRADSLLLSLVALVPRLATPYVNRRAERYVPLPT